MKDVNNMPSGFRLSELEEQLSVLLEDKNKNIHSYICCEHVGEPWGLMEATA